MRLVTVSQTCLRDLIIVYPAGKRVHARVYASFVVPLVWIVYQEMHTVVAQRVVRRVRVSAVSMTPRNAFGLHVNCNRLHLHANIVSSITIVQ